MPVTKVGGVLTHIEGGRTVWAANHQPALLFPAAAVTPEVSIWFPHLQTGNAYAYANSSGGPFAQNVAATYITAVPQEYDSGLLGPIAVLPDGCNYFRAEAYLARTSSPYGFMGSVPRGDPGATIPKLIAESTWVALDGAATMLEQVSSLRRMFRLERLGNAVYLRVKQSVNNGGFQFNWLPGNSPTGGAGQQLTGWTYGGPALAAYGWPFYERDARAGGTINRGQGNQLPVDDITNFSSTWTGLLRITPGYIKG